MTTPSRPELDAWIDPAWGQWVHDNLNRQATFIAATLNLVSQSVGTAGVNLTGSVTVPDAPYDRIVTVVANTLMATTASTDQIITVAGSNTKLTRATGNQNVTTIHTFPLAASAGAKAVGVRWVAASGTVTASTSGAAERCYLQVTVIPVNTL